MQDAIALGTGNSRYLRSIAGFLQQYPTYEDFAAALVAGTLPIDLNGLNPDGWAQQGTPLDKANFLTDATAAILMLTDDATVNDMLMVLANKALAAERTVKSGTAEIAEGSILETNTIYVMYEEEETEGG